MKLKVAETDPRASSNNPCTKGRAADDKKSDKYMKKTSRKC